MRRPGAPVGVSEGCEFRWIDREFDEGFEFGAVSAGETDTEFFAAFQVADDVFGGVDVAG